ncbi:TonB-dependent receptor [Hephaestia sp. GCM10023244]|uniref:TonB-dependent receptor n=1 Tax=unclassified Hephaestia TaxID=2631281 RepID=UPI002076EBC7|nr:TonB-dependent receptor [Hephaestia sp. MAHUQ-44]MCM8731605.1 TonB-dependent receptor [Hephaestia sp. MAHUQ-44]
MIATNRFKLAGVSLFAMALVVGTPAQAQDVQADDGVGSGLNEIIVTAQKREQRLQDVPVSIVAISGAALDEMKITDLRSIQGYVPNLSVLNSGVNPVVFIRGFGSGPNNVAFDQEVSVYLDGIYGGRGAQFSAPFFDLERMEVLRGPQGALFGRNTAAGAISLVSAKPSAMFEGYVSAGYDVEREGYEVSGVVSGPLSETLKARFAGKITRQDGYIRNLFDGDDDPQLRDELARLTLVWQPATGVDITGKVEYGRHLLLGGVNVTGSLTQRTNFDKAGDVRYVSDNYAGAGRDEHSGIKSWNGVVTANVEVGEHTITAIGGLSTFDTRRFTAYDERNPDGIVAPGDANAKFGNGFPERFEQWSAELRLSSPTGGFLEYVTGVYYDHSDYDLHQDSFYRDIGGTITGHQSTDFNQKGDAYSFYGQGTLNFTPALRLIAGLRYSHTTKDAVFDSRTVSGSPLNAIGPQRRGSLSESYLDPSATFQADLAPDVMFYASFGRGSKSGGFVSNTYNVAADGFQFRPERSTNYEAGIKSTVLDGRATINVTVFRTEFEDLQQSAYDPDRRTFFTRNAAKARSQGVEFDMQLAPSRNLQFNASIAYLDAKFVDYPGAPCLAYETLAQCNSADPASIAAHNIAGLPLQFAPEWSGNVGVRHTLNLGDFRLVSNANTSFRSDYFVADGYSPIWGVQDGWAKLDARLQFGPKGDRWNIALIGRNLLNKKTVGAAIRLPPAITGVTRSLNWMDEYRSLMLQGTVRF